MMKEVDSTSVIVLRKPLVEIHRYLAYYDLHRRSQVNSVGDGRTRHQVGTELGTNGVALEPLFIYIVDTCSRRILLSLGKKIESMAILARCITFPMLVGYSGI
jgi:hypothetical protein